MKSIKKILAAVMATAVVGAACIVPASAAYDTTAEFSVDEVTITMEEAAGKVDVYLNLNNNTVFNSTAFAFDFDSTDITLTAIGAGPATQEVGGLAAGNKAAAKVAMACTPGDFGDGIGQGQIVRLVFTINDPQPGDVYPISVSNYNDVVQEIVANEKVVLTPSYTAGYIKIAEETTTTTTTTEITTTTTPEPTTTTVTTTTTDDEGEVSDTTTKDNSGNSKGDTNSSKTNTSKETTSPTTGDTSSAAGMLAVLGLAGAAAVATKKSKKN